jgi:hypothetical protein
LAFDALEPLEPEPDALANQGQLGLERSRVAAPRAQRQYHSVAPETRLVARSLEPRWEAKLRAVEVVEPQDQTWRQPHPAESTAAERHEILAIGENLPAVWQAPTTTMADRKHLLRLSIKPVRVDRHRVGGKWWFQSTWQTGASSRQALTRYDIGDQASGDGEQLETRTRQLHAAQHPDKHIAARRKAAGSRPPDGGTCRFQNSGHLGQRWGLVKINAGAMTPARFRGGAGADTIRGILQPLSVSKAPVQRWRQEGRLQGRQQGPYMPSRFYLTQAQLQPLREPVKRSGDPAATRAECAQVEPAGDADGSPHLAVSVTSVILAGYREPGSYPAGGHYEAIEQGFRARVLSPLLGAIRWRRRVGRCPHGGVGSSVAPVAPALSRRDKLGVSCGVKVPVG